MAGEGSVDERFEGRNAGEDGEQVFGEGFDGGWVRITWEFGRWQLAWIPDLDHCCSWRRRRLAGFLVFDTIHK
jgi:hypothetical protein